MDYEGIPFRCHKCHQYGHMEKHCQLTIKNTFERSRKCSINLEGKYHFKGISADITTKSLTPDTTQAKPLMQIHRLDHVQISEGTEKEGNMQNAKATEAPHSSDKNHVFLPPISDLEASFFSLSLDSQFYPISRPHQSGTPVYHLSLSSHIASWTLSTFHSSSTPPFLPEPSK